MLRALRSRSVFSLLLLNTIVSTVIVALVSVVSLQRVADEHPRRQLSRVLFAQLAELQDHGTLDSMRLDGGRLEIYPLDDLPRDTALPFEEILEGIDSDPDNVAITRFRNHFLAATIADDSLVVLPQFGRSLSTQALVLIAIVVSTIAFVVLANLLTIRYLTRPFSVFKSVVRNVDDGNLSYRVPVERTYGEFEDLARSFNGMLQRIEHVNAARKQMLLAIPHEVRTPLARLKVRKDLISDSDLKAEISKDIDSLEELLETILETERIQTNEGKVLRETLNVNVFFSDVVNDARELSTNVHFHMDIKNKFFYADGFCLSLLMKNLIANAIRYGRNRPIRVVVSDDASDASTMVISVTDQGIGIPADKIPYLTEPFWRLDESRQRNSGGYGLGLHLCNAIVKGHDGIMNISSELGIGTTVRVFLPGALARDRTRRNVS